MLITPIKLTYSIFVFLLLCCTLFLYYTPFDPQLYGFNTGLILNHLHIVGGYALGLITAWHIQKIKKLNIFYNISLCLLALLIITSLLEIGQGFTSREVSLLDWSNGFLNSVMGALTIYAFYFKRKIFFIIMLLLSAVSLSMYGITPIIQQILIQNTLKKNFPLIDSFENEFSAEIWKLRDSKCKQKITTNKTWSSHENTSLTIDKNAFSCSGLKININQTNWENYKKLNFDTFNNSNSCIRAKIRLYTKSPHLNVFFDNEICLNQGESKNVISLEKISSKNLNTITRMDIIFPEKNPNKLLFIDNIRLTK